jgi:cysteine synthase A
MNKIYNSIIETIGNTPIIKLNRIVSDIKSTVLVKCESFNPGGSIKDRIGASMIEKAEQEGILNKDSHIIEPTSGNTGIGLAMVCAAKGYKISLTMPESMSSERRNILKALGANLILTPASQGMKGAIGKASEMAKIEGNIFIPQQFMNLANPEIHRKTTAVEILEATNGNLDAFVAGIGTGGTITGVGEILKKKIGSKIKIYGIEPENSPVLSGGSAGPHKIQGIGAGFIPDVLNTSAYDDIIRVKYIDAIETSRNLAKLEGIFVGISSGAAAWAAIKVAKKLRESQSVLAILPDTGERYLSTELWS